MVIKSLVCIAIIMLWGCSHDAEVASTAEAQPSNAESVAIADLEPAKEPPESPVKVVGTFSNMKGDGGEHNWGFVVDLWQQDDRIYGVLGGGYELRLLGDPPKGLLEDGRLDPRTRKLTFRVKMSDGYVYEFDGVMAKKKIVGILKPSNGPCDATCSKRRTVILRRAHLWDAAMKEYRTAADFNTAMVGDFHVRPN